MDSYTSQQITDGSSTKENVVALVGKPMEIKHEDTGDVYVYEKTLSKPNYPAYCYVALFMAPSCYTKFTTEVSRLSVVFNQEGVVQKHFYDEMLYHGPYYQNAEDAKIAAAQAAAAAAASARASQNSSTSTTTYQPYQAPSSLTGSSYRGYK